MRILDDGRIVDENGQELETLKEESFFFRLSAFEERLLEHYKKHPDAILPKSRYHEVVRFIEGGLNDLSISRQQFKWGIDVPDAKGHVMYVWIDALVNYLSAIGYPKEHRRLWPASIHVIGKDILRFHAVYWPAMLMAADLPLPQKIIAHGWWTNEGEKISKSTGNVIDPFALVEEWGLDAVRYFLLRAMPFGNDGDFSKEAMHNRINGELVNGIGNLCQRVLRFIERQHGGRMPQEGVLNDEDKALLAKAETLPPAIEKAMGDAAFYTTLEDVAALVAEADRYIARMAPWQLKKTDPARMESVLWVMLQILAHVMAALMPFMPETMNRLREQLAMPPSFECRNPTASLPQSGAALPAPDALFPRYDS